MDRNILFERKTALILCLIIIIYLLGAMSIYEFTADDSYISLRYAETLANHGQLSFNPGDRPSEGFTNLLLVLIEAVLIKLGMSNPIVVPKIIGIIAGAGTIFLTYLITAQAGLDNKWFQFIPSLVLALSTPFLVWSVGGLETTLFTFLIMAGIFSFIVSMEREDFRCIFISDFMFFLSILCRPEGLLFWGLSYIFLLINVNRASLKSRIKSAFIFFLILAGYLLWKYSYFGDVLPLTYYAKQKGFSMAVFTEGVIRFWKLIKINLNLVHISLFILAVIGEVRNKNPKTRYIFSLSIIYALYVISMGRVAMDHTFRFWVPVLPLLYIASAKGLSRVIKLAASNSGRVANYVVLIFVIFQITFGVLNLNYVWNKDMTFGCEDVFTGMSLKDFAYQWKNSFIALALKLKKDVPPNSTIVMSDVGAVPYYSKLRVIDTNSLVTRELVMLNRESRKYPVDSAEYKLIVRKAVDFVFSKNPEVVIETSGLPMLTDPRFSKYTQMTELYWRGQYYPVWIRKDLFNGQTL